MNEPTSDQRQKERAVFRAILMDTATISLFVIAGAVSGSLTAVAEALRGFLGYILECFTLVLLRRIHRGVLVDMEYGSGKVEQVGNVMIGASMLLAGGWVAMNAMHIITGQRDVGTPAALAFAAMTGMFNVYINVMAWDGVRRAAANGRSLLMDAQVNLRKVKLGASLVVIVGMTISALSSDELVVAWADALGSLFVAAYLFVNAAGVLRSAVPDLLDRSAGNEVAELLKTALDAHREDYVRVERLRTRRSGRTTFIEIALGVDLNLTMAEVHRRVETLKATIRRDVEDADISIVTSVVSEPS